MGPGDLAQALEGFTPPSHPNVLVGINPADDAGVYRLTDDVALVQTIDFFTPIVDDPYLFGRIAAANALSDVYAMGATPITALNIVCFPKDDLPMVALRDTLRGGLDVCTEVGVALLGGHSVTDREFKYGMAVTGTVAPDRVLTKEGARPGDRLILTKAIGTGAVTTGIKRAIASPADVEAAVTSMSTLNRAAAELLIAFEVHAMTDVTGFGLLGHGVEMIVDSGVGFEIHVGDIPLLPGALACAEAGVMPGGMARNRSFRQSAVDVDPAVAAAQLELLYDPQTSGGLLAAVAAEDASRALDALHAGGVSTAAIIGEVRSSPAGRITVSA